MVHVFHYKDKYYIFDTGSSSLHECDEPTARLMRAELGEAVDLTDICEEDRAAARNDFEELRREGLLFAEEKKIYPP